MRRGLVVVVVAWLVIAAGPAAVPLRPAQAAGDSSCAAGQICVWSEKGYGGAKVAYGADQLANGKCYNQTFHSIKNMSANFKAVVYNGADCKEAQSYGDMGGCCLAGYDAGRSSEDVGMDAKSVDIVDQAK